MGNVPCQKVAPKNAAPHLNFCTAITIYNVYSEKQKEQVKMFTLFNKMMSNQNDPYIRLFKTEYQSDFHRAIKNGERVDGKFAKKFLKSQGVL
jgi:hypothetical protein